jgi:tetratricopeptide (TPR) repeat protein
VLAPVSLCVIARNEEAALPACLASVADLVREMIVVDTGSTDATKAAALRAGARAFDWVWIDSFAAARNESLRHASCPWVLWLDADESFDDPNRARLRALLSELPDDNVAYAFKQRSTPADAGSAPVDVEQVRLFRRDPRIFWEYRVHEQVLPALGRLGVSVRFTDIAVTHTGYQDPAVKLAKLQRNLRLLALDHAERPDDPFVLFNLGWAEIELGRPAAALPLLQRSLDQSHPAASIVRKLYALLGECLRKLGRHAEALAACRAGRGRCPDDLELLYLEGRLLREGGDQAGAAACFEQVLRAPPGAYFASVDAGLRSFKTRHELARLYREAGRPADAERQWRAAVGERPDFAPGWQGLGELFVDQGRWAELEEAALRLGQAAPTSSAEAALLRARGLLARREFAAARQALEVVIAQDPRAVGPRVRLTHVLLQEDRDRAAAESALRKVLELDVRQPEAWRNLAVLLRRQGRTPEAHTACTSGLVYCPDDVDLLILSGVVKREQGDVAGAEAALVRSLELVPPVGVAGRGLRTTARHHLAALLLGAGRGAEAEKHWRAVLAEQPAAEAAWRGLGEVYLAQGRWAELEEVSGRLANGAPGSVEVEVLRARGELARKEFGAARRRLEGVIAQAPQAVGPRLVLSYVYLQERKDGAAAERALREVLTLAPDHAEARHNLALLLRRQAETGKPPG